MPEMLEDALDKTKEEPPAPKLGEFKKIFKQVFESTEGQPSMAESLFVKLGGQLIEKLKDKPSTSQEEVDKEFKLLEKEDAEETGIEITEDGIMQPEESPWEGTSINVDQAKLEALEAYEGMNEELKSTISQAHEALSAGDINKAADLAKNITSKMAEAGKDKLTPESLQLFEDVKSTLSEALSEEGTEKKSKLYRFACSAADFIPVAGPAKMLAEAAEGKTLGGEKLSGWKRFLHGTEGAVFLIIDLTGAGVALTKGAKAGKSAPKLMTRGAAFLRTLGVPKKVYKPLYKGGKMLARHPALSRLASRGLNSMGKARKLRMADLPKNLRNTSERPGMDLEKGLKQPAEQAA